MRERRESRPNLNLTDAQLGYMRTGKTDDPDVFLDWAYGRNEEEVRRIFEAIRSDYPVGYFEWAEKNFGEKR